MSMSATMHHTKLAVVDNRAKYTSIDVEDDGNGRFTLFFDSIQEQEQFIVSLYEQLKREPDAA